MVIFSILTGIDSIGSVWKHYFYYSFSDGFGVNFDSRIGYTYNVWMISVIYGYDRDLSIVKKFISSEKTSRNLARVI